MVAGKHKTEKAKDQQHLETGVILSPSDFNTLVNHERIRSDRFGCTFSIVSLKFMVNQGGLYNDLLHKVINSIRCVDRVAWDRQGNVTILLPDTDYAGALVFCQKCRSILGHHKHYSDLEIYSYPDHWISNYQGRVFSKETLSEDSKAEIESIFVETMPAWKRVTDIVISSLMILALSPLLLGTAIFIKIVSPGPVLFRQYRIGYKGIPFQFYKFRSMKHGNDQGFHGKHSQSFIKSGDIPMDKLDGHDPRIIPGGRVLRKSCIDELPQLWNIVKGDMSLVGPRPCIPYEAQEYLRWHTHRFDIVPGLTGLWQVSGKNKLTFKQMIRLDIAYSKNISFRRDIWILLKTPFAIVGMIYEAVVEKLQTRSSMETSCHTD